MNIALIIERLVGGGAERVVAQLALGLQQRGYGVFVYCLRTPGEPGAALADAGVRVRAADSRGRDPGLAWRLLRWLQADRIDVAHAHSSAAVVWTLPGARLLGIPVIQTRHGTLLGPPSRYRRLAETCAPAIARTVIVAEALRARLRPRRVARAAVHIPNGLDQPVVPRLTARAELADVCGRTLNGPVILYVGTLCPEKDICGLLTAYALVRRDVPEAQLVCIGPQRQPEYWEAVQRCVTTLGLDGHAVFTGAVTEPWRLMAGADVFCLASATEALPNVLLEAMSQGVPIVATTVGDVGRLHSDVNGPWLLQHGETALLVPPGQPTTLATALALTLNDPQGARARAEQAQQQYRARHTSVRMLDGHEELYAMTARPRRRAQAGPVPPPGTRPAVLMLGPAPPQIGGMVTSIGLLMSSPLQQQYELHRGGVSYGARTAAEFAADAPRVAPGRWPAVRRHVGALRDLARTLRDRHIALLHIHTCSYFSFYRNAADAAVARRLGCRVLLHIRGNRFDRFCRDSGPLARRFIRRTLERADGVIVLSRSWRDALLPYAGKARLYVVPNAFDPAIVAAETPSRPPGDRLCRFVFLAALTQAKGLADLLEAACLARDHGARFELLIAGPVTPAQQQRWDRQVRDGHLEGIVQFVGPVRGADKARFLAQADVLVHPSHSEGLPNTVLEGAAAGLPVIATTVGAVPEVFAELNITDVAHQPVPLPLVPPHAPAALAAQMLRLAGDPGVRGMLAAAMSRHVRANFNVALLAQRIAAIYAEVLGTPPSARATTAPPMRACAPPRVGRAAAATGDQAAADVPQPEGISA